VNLLYYNVKWYLYTYNVTSHYFYFCIVIIIIFRNTRYVLFSTDNFTSRVLSCCFRYDIQIFLMKFTLRFLLARLSRCNLFLPVFIYSAYNLLRKRVDRSEKLISVSVVQLQAFPVVLWLKTLSKDESFSRATFMFI